MTAPVRRFRDVAPRRIDRTQAPGILTGTEVVHGRAGTVGRHRDGGGTDAVATLGAMFAGPTPSMVDFF